MSRGRRNPPRVASPRAPDIVMLLRDAAPRIAAKISDGRQVVRNPPAGGGLTGDLDWHAGDLVELALLSAVGGSSGHPLAVELLERAQAHQIEHIRRLIAAREHPRSVGAEIWRRYNLPHGRDSVRRSYDLLRRERERLEEIERLQTALPTDSAGVRRGPFTRHAIRLVSAEPLRRLMSADPQRALTLAGAVAAELRDEQIQKKLAPRSPASVRAAARLIAADAILKAQARHPLDVIADAPEDLLRQRQLERAAGDAGEAARAEFWKVPPDPTAPLLFPSGHDHYGYESHPVLDPAGDAGTALARALGLLRRPEQHVSTMLRIPGRLLTVPVTRFAFEELAAEPGQDLELLRGPGATGLIRLALVRRAEIQGQAVEVRFSLDLGESRYRAASKLADEFRDSPSWPVGVDACPAKAHAWPAPSQDAHAVQLGRRSTTGPRRSPEDFLAPDDCSHPDGSWHLSARKDAAIFTCPRCLRRRIAVEPLHRLPAAHPLWAQSGLDETTYLRFERAARVLAGQPDPGETATIAYLVAEDSLADLAPATAHSGTGVAGTKKRPRSLAEVFARV